MVITTSKLNNNIVFSRAIFWGPRANEMRTGVEEHKHPIVFNIVLIS